MKELKTPYKNLNPPLTPEAMKLLRANIDAVGVLQPVLIDEEGNVLDGHHRLEIDPDAPLEVIKGKTDAEKRAIVLFSNGRQLDAKGRKHVLAEMKKTAFAMREEDPKKWTQAAVAAALGVDRSTVEKWYQPKGTGHNENVPNVSAPDARVSVTEDKKQEIVERIEAGETQAAVANDLGVSTKTIHRIVAGETEKEDMTPQNGNKKRTCAHKLSEKIIEISRRVDNGQSVTQSCATLGVSESNYRYGRRIVNSGNETLITAMDKELPGLSIGSLAKLIDKTPEEINNTISILETKLLLAKTKKLSIKGKKKWQIVLSVLTSTSTSAYSLIHQKQLVKASIPPSEDDRRTLLRLCDHINRTMNEITEWAQKGCENV